MYETVDALFTGICDSIREKDGTTDLISHQDIPARIASISGGGEGVISPFYTYDGGGLKIENMVASNFAAYSAIFLQEAFLPGELQWEIGVKFTWPVKTKPYHTLFGSWVSGGMFGSPAVTVENYTNVSKVVAGVPDGNNAWNNVGEQSVVATVGEWYWLRFKFDGEKYVVSLSTNGQEFEDIIQIEYGVMYQDENKSKLSFGGTTRSSNHYFEGSIDLKETYIKIGEEIWWGGNKKA